MFGITLFLSFSVVFVGSQFPTIPSGQPIIIPGQCDLNMPVAPYFDVSAFAGTWHEIYRFHSELQIGHCASSSLITTGGTGFTLTQYSVMNEELITATGTAEADPDGSGAIDLYILGAEGVVSSMTVHVLATDSEFALIYSCREIDENRKQIYSWKLSRNREGLSPNAIETINEVVATHPDLREDYYRATDQSNDGCFYYPVFNPLPDAIVLPGPCDDRIQGIANFNVTAYLGQWHEMEKYPHPSQTGTCARAEYNIGEGDEILVSNNQVINQTLQVQNGYAVVASDDGRGILNVSFIVGNVTNYANYYILETDYTTFSVVYSCRNLNNGSSQVSSWILSRFRWLTYEARDIADEVIARTRGLRPEYYVVNELEDLINGDCFYIPELNENKAPVFRETCPSIPGLANFSMTLGLWHEIERYAVDHNIGDCISSRYTSSGSSFRATDTHIADLTANVTTALMSIISNRLVRIFPDGTVIDTRVLATDHENYALLYSCEIIFGQNFDHSRRVWSAKHSRSREGLSTAAQDAMASVIENQDDLVQELYMKVDQSDSACFHYPDPPQSGGVILPGQCNEDIPAVIGFNPVDYNGTWYLIEKYPYPQTSVSAACIGTQYIYNVTTNVMSILNWEVVGDTLVTVEGSAILATDNSGRLTVTMTPISAGEEPVTKVLHILATDYTTFSLALTCENVNQYERAVFAFKLSRGRTMPEAANIIIDNVIAEREELHQPYFIQIEQDEECEEPDWDNGNTALLVRSSIIVLTVCGLWQLLL